MGKSPVPDSIPYAMFIFFAVQRFLSQTKRCYFIEENKPAMQAVPQNQADIANPNIENDWLFVLFLLVHPMYVYDVYDVYDVCRRWLYQS